MKAILVIDMPNGYEADQLVVNYLLYSVDGKVLDGDMGIELKPMPQELPTPYMMRQIMIADGIQTEKPPYTEDYQKGYNDCINEILGETE